MHSAYKWEGGGLYPTATAGCKAQHSWVLHTFAICAKKSTVSAELLMDNEGKTWKDC